MLNENDARWPVWLLPCKKAWRAPTQKSLSILFPDRASAEAALKAYADAHPGWKVVEE